MNDQPPGDQESEIPGYREELAAEIAVKKMLTRIRLEDAAKGPVRPAWLWAVRYILALVLIFLGGRAEYQGVVISFLVLSLLSGNGETQFNTRIDAILKLAELDKNEAQAAAAELGK